MKAVIFVITIVVIVGAGVWYLMQTPCTGECPETPHQQYCDSLKPAPGSEYDLTYGQRMSNVFKGCF
jgi:hypothetical protein